LEKISVFILILEGNLEIDNRSSKVIAIIGGTGKEGKGLAFRWAKAGHQVIIGSRNEEKAQCAAKEVKEYFKSKEISVYEISGKSNKDALEHCDLAALTVPYEYHSVILQEMKPYLQGKYLLDATVPLVPPKISIVQIPPNGSAAMQAQTILGEGVKVISAFQNISFELLLSENKVDCDVLVCGVDIEARELGLQLVRDAGLIGWDAGPLENSIVQEGLTSILIRINKKFGVTHSGIQITGVPRP
jgi:8-hydroxy-5-deazaflavin:NADPH oxidoreductase